MQVNPLYQLYHVYIDIDECSNSNGGCQHNCSNIVGSHYCSCAAGYSLDDNDHSCLSKIHHTYIVTHDFLTVDIVRVYS